MSVIQCASVDMLRGEEKICHAVRAAAIAGVISKAVRVLLKNIDRAMCVPVLPGQIL